ncbi:MAG: tetratricopeptide repeat protein [Nitrospirota bacterium]
MQNSEVNLLQDIYSRYLVTIKDIKFTRREIDVISCLLGGRSAKKIASILSVAPRTVESHVHNIMVKLSCGSRESIRDFIETSGQSSIIRKYYQTLLIDNEFRKQLKKICTLTHNKSVPCCLVLSNIKKENSYLLQKINHDLNLTNIKIVIQKLEKDFLYNSNSFKNDHSIEHILYIISKDDIEFFVGEKHTPKIHLTQGGKNIPTTFAFVFKPYIHVKTEKDKTIILEDCNYYDFIFNILKKILTDVDFSPLVTDFRTVYSNISESLTSQNQTPADEQKRYRSYVQGSKKSWPRFRFLLIGSVLLSFGVLILPWIHIKNQKQYKKVTFATSIHSDFLIPTNAIILKRSDLLNKIESVFNKTKSIKVVVLSGIGGAGKTTLARYYARTYPAPLLWEIHAETKDNLRQSFEQLANRLSTTDEDKQILQSTKEAKNIKEKDNKLISFVSKKLQNQPEWLLVYDNVEDFSEVGRFFPQDTEVWGSGRVIITTRDSRSHPHRFPIVKIGSLNKREKQDFFTKLFSTGNNLTSDIFKEKEIKNFLDNIPPFPLDISIAAHYLQITNISFQEYLDRLKKNNDEFENIQKEILHDSSDYGKTRYNIITLLLNKIIDKHKDFKSIALFISLLNSQNIPRDMLDFYKKKEIVDHFLFHLKKNSLLTNETHPHVLEGSTFSLHRVTQEMFLNYFVNNLSSEEKEKLFTEILGALTDYTQNNLQGNDLKHFNFPKFQLITQHAESFLMNQKLLNTVKSKNITTAAVLLCNIGIFYRELGKFKKSEEWLQKSYMIIQKNKETECIHAAKSLGNLAVTYGFQGVSSKAYDCHKKALRIYYNTIGKDHIDVAWQSVHFGNTCRDLGMYEKALNLYQKSYRVFSKHDGKNHYHVAWCLGNQGDAYRRLGYYKKAQKCLEESLQIYTNHYPQNKLKEAWSSIQLGKIYTKLARYEEAKRLLSQSLNIYTKYYGPNNIRSVEVLAHLGNIYARQKNYAKSKELLKKNLEFYKNYYGDEHVLTAMGLKDIGVCYLQEGSIEIAEVTLKAALAILQKENHSEIYICTEYLAAVCWKKYEKAERQENQEDSQQYKQETINYLKLTSQALAGSFPRNSPHIERIKRKLLIVTDSVGQSWVEKG